MVRSIESGEVPALFGIHMANFTGQRLGSTALLIFVLVPLGLCHLNCDIGSCSSLFQSTFSNLLSDGIESMCRDIEDVLKCVKDCHKIFLPYLITTNSTIYFLKEVCNGDFVFDLNVHWQCISQHLNRLLTCVAAASSMESIESKHVNERLISCRKVLKIVSCPEEVLFNQCEDKVVEVVTEVFHLGLKPLQTNSCFKISSNKAFGFNVRHRIDTEYNRIALCMDNNSYLAKNCFEEYLEKAAHSELHSCSDNDAETVCNSPSSSIPCSSLTFISDFYSTIFSYGKKECNRSASNLYRLKSHRNTDQTDTNGMEFHKTVKTPPLVEDVTENLSHTSSTAVTHSTLEELNITLPVTDSKESYSTLNSQTDEAKLDKSEVLHSSSTTMVPGNLLVEPVLSDSPQNLSNTQMEDINDTLNVNNAITQSNNYHTSCGAVFVSFTYIFFSVLVILF